MKPHITGQRQDAAALVEVVIAISIVGLVAAGLLGAFNSGACMMARARENQRASQVMLEKVETIRLYSWSQVNSNGFVPAKFTAYYDPQAKTGAQGPLMKGTMSIGAFPYSTSYQNNLRQLTVTLEWTGAGNIKRTRALTTFIAKDGMQNYVY